VDEVAWLMAREIPRLRRYALALAGEPAAADDLVQDSLERAIRKRHLWQRYGSIRAWLYRILFNVYLNQRTQRTQRQRQLPLEGVADALAVPAPQEHRIDCTDIATAMHDLPDEQRAAILLTALEGLSYDEAAAILDIPVGTLRSRLSRGRDRLRALYRPADKRAQALRRVK